MKEFPIPVVAAIGPGSQVEDETLEYMSMPQGMTTFSSPVLPEAEDVAGCSAARGVLQDALVLLEEVLASGGTRRIDLSGLPAADLQLVNQVLGEGEVGAVVHSPGDSAHEIRAQESVFAGVWRVVITTGGKLQADYIEVGAAPDFLVAVAREDVRPALADWTEALPPGVQNAPSLLAEIEDQCALWSTARPAHVVNLTLLPMSPEDIGFMDHHLGTGRILVLSRGYGNCRITNTCRPNCWRVVYYNSQDVVILNTVEISALPEVAQAAAEDLRDSQERLREVLAWIESA